MSWRVVPTCAAVFATLLLFPASGWALVERSGDTFFPKTGPELSEAATTISSEGASDASFKATVELVAGTYSVASPVVFTSLSAPTVRGPEAGGRAIVTNSGSPITLLRLSSRDTTATSGISNVDFTLKGTLTSGSVIALDLQRGSQLRDSTVKVPSSTMTATAIRLSPALGIASPASPAVLQRVTVQSNAPSAPAVRATNGSQVLDSTITGGAPALEIAGDASGADLGNVTVDSTRVKSTGTDTTVPIVRVRGGGNHVRAVLWSTVVDGTLTGAQNLVDILGPTSAAGSVDVELGQSSLRGVATTPSRAVRVQPGLGAAKLTLKIRGLLSLGSLTTVDCMATPSDPASSVEVTIAGIYRSGSNAAGTKCTLAESALRTGTLSWRDESNGDLHPVWNSPLVDAVSSSALPALTGTHDADGGARFVQIGSGAPGDIGALEYQLTPPEGVSANFTTLGNRGLTALVGAASDPDEFEEPQLRFRWTLPDNSTVAGKEALYRFGSATPQEVTLDVIDVTGRSVQETITVNPVVRLDEPARDFNVPEEPGPVDPSPVDPVPVDPVPVPPEPVGPQFVFVPPTIPSSLAIPKVVTADPKPDPSLKQDFPPILKSVKARSRRVLTSRKSQPMYAAARPGEAEFVIETWRESEMALEVSTVLEGKGLTVGLPVATVPLKEFKGRKTLRVGAKVGKRKLKPGLYQMTIAATPRPGAVPERLPFYVRVVRAR